MKVPMKKVLFIGAQEANEAFFQQAQKLGCFEFISQPGHHPHYFPKPMEELREAIKILRKQPVKPQETTAHDKARSIVEEILGLQEEIDRLEEEIRLLDTEIVKVRPLGDFDVEMIEDLKSETGQNFQFFFVRHERLLKEPVPSELVFITREYDFDYYMYVGKEPFEHSAFNEIHVRKGLKSLQSDRKNLEQKLSHKQSDLKQTARYLDFLYDYMLFEMNQISLNFAQNDVDLYLDEALFVITAWVPKNKFDRVIQLTKDYSIYAMEVAIEKGDALPTLLENKGLSASGQDLVEVYDIPDPTDPDPSVWVIWSFAIFFSMIVSDAGYGFLYLFLALFLRFRFPEWKGLKKRFVNMLTLLSLMTIAWGFLVASYFSIKLEPGSILNKVSLLYQMALEQVTYHMAEATAVYKEWVEKYPSIAETLNPAEILQRGYKVKDGKKIYLLMESIYDSILLEIALFVGVIHLSFAFLRNLRRNWSGVGWIAALWGGYFFFPKIIGATSMVQYLGWMNSEMAWYVGQQLLYGGLIGALILAVIQHKLAGFATIFKVIEVFADTLSYLRLYALGLASMILAATFNELGEMAGGYIFGALVILFGHTVNISLGLMAAVIHGLRLNFLEWYHHCFDGGGRKFNPLRNFVRE